MPRGTRSTVALWALGVAAIPTVTLGQPVALGPQFEVSSALGTPAYNGDVAVAADGGFVVVWQDYTADGDDYEVLARRYDAAAVPQGPSFVVNTYTTYEQEEPSVAMLPGGGFVVVWQSYAQLDQDHEIFGQRFDAGGAPAGGEFQVNTHTDEAQRNPEVAADANGRFVVAWDSYYQFGTQDRDDIVARRFDADGMPLSAEFQVNAFTTGQQDEPDAAALPSGEFVIVWQGDYGAEAQRYDDDGNAAGAGIVVEPDGFRTRVSAHTGGFVTAFTAPGAAIGVRPYDASGVPLAPVTPVVVSGPAVYPDIAATTDGQFLVVWQDDDGSFGGVMARLYDASATPIGDAFVVNTYTTGGQGDAAVAANAAGDIVVTWAGDGPDGEGFFARRFTVSASSAGVTSKKLVILDRLASAGDAKVVWVSKDETAGITKGSGTDVEAIHANFTVSYDSASGAFTIPPGASDGTEGWLVNSSTVAKYSNKGAPAGATSARVAVVKPGKLLKIVGKSLGDQPIDLVDAGAPVGPILTEFRVTNGGETFRFCSAFDPMTPNAVAFKEIAGGTGRKLVARDGVPVACP